MAPEFVTVSLTVNMYWSSTEMVRWNTRPWPPSQVSVTGFDGVRRSPSAVHTVEAFGSAVFSPAPATKPVSA